MTKPDVSIVLGSYNRIDFLKLAIESARKETATIPHEILVVDGGSDDGSLEWLALQKDVVTIIQYNRGTFRDQPIERRSWGYFMNLVFKCAQADAVLMMSDDTIFHDGAVKNGLQFFRDQMATGKKIGAVPFYFHDVDSDPADTYKISQLFGHPFLNHGIYYKEALAQVGYADETTYVFFAADADICYKLIHAGYAVLPCPTALMLHCPTHPMRQVTTPSDRWLGDVTALVNKWGGILVDKDVKIVEGFTDIQTITYHDTSGLGKLFDEAIRTAQSGTTSGLSSTHNDVVIGQIDARLASILTTLNYVAKQQDMGLQQQNRQNDIYHLDWLAFWNEWKAFNRPYYRRMLSTWAIFMPLRWLKNRRKG
ncbi:MAG: glycosyltransferase [bacterium]|nr:glycosyltransferase [bacterium]